MSRTTLKSSPPQPSRDERIDAILQQLRPKIDRVVRQMVERAVDVPEAEEFGAIDHAAEHVCDFAKARYGPDDESRTKWAVEAKGILYERGGEALLTHLHAVELPAEAKAEVVEELRKLIGYFENNRHRTDYPGYRAKGWDIGSGPTEAGCKIIGERLKGSGMRWVEEGAATVGALRALYVSGGKVWDGFWSQAHTMAA